MRNSMKDPALQEVTLHALYHEGGVLPCMHYIMRVAFLVFASLQEHAVAMFRQVLPCQC